MEGGFRLPHAKVRAAALKKAGHVPKKRKIAVEEHYDDLGDDLSGLGGDIDFWSATYHVEEYEPNSSSDEEHVSGMITSFIHGERHWFNQRIGAQISPKMITPRDVNAMLSSALSHWTRD